MDERTLEYGTNTRDDFYQVLYHVLINHSVNLRDMRGYSSLTTEQKRGITRSLECFSELVVNLAFVDSSRGGQINPVHRPVVEQLMTDLQAMLDKMPVEEKPNVWELADESAREAGALKALEIKSAALARKTWICPDHGVRPWQSKPMVLRGWCHKELADGTECGHELVEKPKPEGMFHNA